MTGRKLSTRKMNAMRGFRPRPRRRHETVLIEPRLLILIIQSRNRIWVVSGPPSVRAVMHVAIVSVVVVLRMRHASPLRCVASPVRAVQNYSVSLLSKRFVVVHPFRVLRVLLLVLSGLIAPFVVLSLHIALFQRGCR